MNAPDAQPKNQEGTVFTQEEILKQIIVRELGPKASISSLAPHTILSIHLSATIAQALSKDSRLNQAFSVKPLSAMTVQDFLDQLKAKE